MKEQEAEGDLPAIAAAMRIIGASCVETLDTKGTDGSNVHLGGPATITGYFGGIGQPNDHVLQWLDEFLHYYTEYGVRQVLNINPGTVLAGYLLHRLGVDIEFKISVFMGNDNPYAAMWTLIGARLFARDDGTTPLVGFNWGNSANNETLEIAAQVRRALGFEDTVRFEHHITETWKSIVLQPYDRREELIALADHVPNISAKHEGGDPGVDGARAHPSDILDYFRAEAEVIESGDWESLALNFMDKIDATNHTARALTEHGLSFLAARNLHDDSRRCGARRRRAMPCRQRRRSGRSAGASIARASRRPAGVTAEPRWLSASSMTGRTSQTTRSWRPRWRPRPRCGASCSTRSARGSAPYRQPGASAARAPAGGSGLRARSGRSSTWRRGTGTSLPPSRSASVPSRSPIGRASPQPCSRRSTALPATPRVAGYACRCGRPATCGRSCAWPRSRWRPEVGMARRSACEALHGDPDQPMTGSTVRRLLLGAAIAP